MTKKSVTGGFIKRIRQRINRYKNKKISAEAERFLAMAEETARRISEMPEGEERSNLSAELKIKEKKLKDKDKSVSKAYHKMLKSKYIKELIPAVYAEASAAPVEDKVVFVENGRFPSPSNERIYEVLKQQGRYKTAAFSLHIREVSDAEYYRNALSYIRETGTAKAVFLSTANPLMSHLEIRPETRVIQLWHGVGMFKKVGFSTMSSKSFGYSAKTRETYNEYRNYTDVTVAAEEQIWTFEDAFHISRDTGIYKPVGIARTDVFFDEAYCESRLKKLHEAFPSCIGKKLILYAPTFRGSVGKARAPEMPDIHLMAEKLSGEYMLLIRQHGLCKQRPAIPEDLKNSFALDMNENDILTTDDLLAISDILITDYSSLGFEFAVMEKPMVFYAYDLEEYIDGRGMYYDYNEITPGPVCKTTEEVADYIADIGNRFDIEKVRAFRKKYAGACDGHATERTIALIEQQPDSGRMVKNEQQEYVQQVKEKAYRRTCRQEQG